MDYRRVQHFVAVLQYGSMTAAAATLGLSQSALSKSVQLLEKSLGTRLLERNRHGVSATAGGELLYAHAQAAQAELEQAALALSQQADERSRLAVVGCGPSEATRLIGLAISRLRERHPLLRVHVHYGLNEALMPMVKSGEVDFALSSVPTTARDPQLVHEVLHLDGAAVIARSGHPLAARRSIRIAELRAFPWVLARRRELERRALDEIFLSAQVKPIEADVETTSAVLMKTLVMQSDFLTFLPRELIHWEERAGQLCALRIGGSPWVRHVGITLARDATIRPAPAALAEALRAVARSSLFRRVAPSG